MPTFKAVVLEHHIKPDNTVKIKIRITHKRKNKYIDSGLTASTSDINKEFAIKDQAFIEYTNDLIKAYRAKCNINPARIEQMTIDQLADFLTKKEVSTDPDFVAFSVEHAEKLEKNGRVRTAKDYLTALNALKRFVGLESIPVSEIKVKFLQDFQTWIVSNPSNKNQKTSMSRAPSKYLASIRALHNAMKLEFNDEDEGVILVHSSPFARFKMPSPPLTKKRAIDSDLIRKILDLPDEPIVNSKGTNRYTLAKDCFILSFGLIGMNSADLFDCKDISKTTLTYKRMKTRTRRKDEAEISIKIQPEIKGLIEKYRDKSGKRVFNFYQQYANDSNFNKAINVGLKVVGKLIKVNDLEFYAARHSWATIALNKVKIDKYTVHSALNHVDEAMKVTDIYLDKDWSIINDANRKVLDYVMKDRKKAR